MIIQIEYFWEKFLIYFTQLKTNNFRTESSIDWIF